MDKDLEALLNRVRTKRDWLLVDGERTKKWRRHLSLISGVLALISGSTMAALLSVPLDNLFADAATAALAFASGILNLVMHGYFDDKESQQMSEGAAKFLALREKVLGLSRNSTKSSEELHFAMAKLSEEYVLLSGEYDRFILNRFKDSIPP